MRVDRPPKNRRRFLRLALGAVGASVAGRHGLLGTALAQTPAAALSETELRDGLVQIEGAGGNVLLLAASGGTAMVDSGAPSHASTLVAHVMKRLGGPPPAVLFNTHWHLDHTGANDAFASAGTRIVAHELTRLWMSTEYYVDWQDRTYEPRPAVALPTQTFYASDPQPLALEAGDERIEYGHLREAHTDGDIYVFFRNRNVIAAGGAVAAGAYPVLDYATGGWIGGLVDATRKLLDLADGDTLFVPERGPAQPRTHVEAQLQMLTAVRARVEDLMRKGKSAAEMLEAGVTEEFDAAWGDNRERFVSNIYGGLWWQGRLDGSL